MMPSQEAQHLIPEKADLDVEAFISNQSGIPHLWIEQAGAEGERLDVLVIRGTFDFASGGRALALAKVQKPVVLGDRYDGVENDNVIRAVLDEDGDLVPYKPGTDILVSGTASAPGGQPHHHWLASVQVGSVHKTLRLYGPRKFRKGLFGWKMDLAEPITRLELDYRLAYGGCLSVPAALCNELVDDIVKNDNNPAGCGWLPSRGAYSHLPRRARTYVRQWIKAQDVIKGPQIEDAADAIVDPYKATTHGLGPVARWWAPRVRLQGTFDNSWRSQRFPLLPKNFNSCYFQAAPHDLVAVPHLRGDEMITLIGLLPEQRDMRLPGWRIVLVAKRASGEHSIHLPPLDTVRLDLAARQATLVWRANFRFDDDPVTEVVIAATTSELAPDRHQQTGEKPWRIA